MNVLHLVVVFRILHYVWRTLEKAIASPSNSCIMHLHNASVTIYMQQAKLLFDELVVDGWLISLKDCNLYVFCGLRGEFKDLVTSLVTKAKLLSYVDLHNHLFTHEFLHKTSLQSMDGSSPLLSSPLLSQPPRLPIPSNHLTTSQHNSNFSHNRGRSRGN